MKKTLIILAIFLTVVGAGVFFIRQNVGDIKPALLPANSPFPSIQKTSNPSASGDQADFLKVPTGLKITYFAKNLVGARDLEFSPGGTLFLSQTSGGRVVALPDKNEDGISDEIKVVLHNLKNPHGLAFKDGKLFVAEENKVSRYSFNEDTLTATFEKKLVDLPANGGHFTRSLLFTAEGDLLISVGSSCNVCKESDDRRAAILITDTEGNGTKVFAKGTRNSPFMALNPQTSGVWATDMGRDLLGDDIPPEEINILEQGKDYGWPYCYGDRVHDGNFDSKNEYSCANTTPPLFGFQAHSAPLGLTFITSPLFSEDEQGDLLVSYHGSWNRTTPTGYKVVQMEVADNKITGVKDVITGFIEGSSATGRPVDVIFDKTGKLYVSDDKAGVVYVVSATQ